MTWRPWAWLLSLGLLLASPGGRAELPRVELEPVETLAAEAGLALERQRWHLGARSGWAWRVRVRLPGRLKVLAGEGLRPLSALVPAQLTGPWAAINGGFYDVDGSPMGVVISDGEERAGFRRGGGSGVVLVRDGQPRIVHHSEYRPGAEQALQSIDRIVAEGRSLARPRPGAPVAARSAVALTGRELFLVLAAEDAGIRGGPRRARLSLASDLGLPLWAFADYLVRGVGAEAALNLDGGVSSQLSARVGGQTFHITGPRGTINALLVRP